MSIPVVPVPPHLPAPVSRATLVAELAHLAHRAGLGAALGPEGQPLPILIDLTEELALTHCADPRRYAQVDPFRHWFEFAPAVLLLPKRYRIGLIAHEIGHCIDPAPDAVGQAREERADAAAARVLGVVIRYDRAWPGKGLQFVKGVEDD